MPNGKTHTLVTNIAAAVSFPVGWIVAGPFAGFCALSGCLIGIVLTPDLDTDNKNIGYWQLRRINPALEFIWSIIWWPYSRAFQHRSWITHWPMISTIVRILYVLWPFWVIFGLFTVPSWLFCGLVVSDTLHFAMDMLWKDKT